MTPVSLPEAGKTNPAHFTILLTLLAAVSAAYIFVRGAYWTGHLEWMEPGFKASDIVLINVGAQELKLPVGYLKSASQRHMAANRQGNFQAVTLLMTYPDMKMPGAFASFGDMGRPKPLVTVDLESNSGRETLRAQLDPFYRKLARGGEGIGPNGLKILTLSSGAAASRDIIAYDPKSAEGFIARCLKKRAEAHPLCHRAMSVGPGLELRYSFDRSLLPHWQSLDIAVMAMIDNFRSP